MSMKQYNPTKDRILRAAAQMFSERGYDKVTTREIAKAIGINSASIYYHFTSKEEILRSLYRMYTEERRKQAPDISELLRLAESEPPHALLRKSEFHCGEEIREILEQILSTATCMICADPESENFIKENVFDPISNTLKPLLQQLITLNKIEPVDINTFVGLLSYYCFSSAALNNTTFRQSIAEYQATMTYLFSMITAKEDTVA